MNWILANFALCYIKNIIIFDMTPNNHICKRCLINIMNITLSCITENVDSSKLKWNI
jgi:hypothetical protein